MSIQKKLKLQKTQIKSSDFPAIPDKIYFSISEVADLCKVQKHVLRYWEQEFSQLAPSKRRGNRRCYCREDVLLVRQIRYLLYEQGFTIHGARAQLMGQPIEGAQIQQYKQAICNAVADLEALLLVLQQRAKS